MPPATQRKIRWAPQMRVTKYDPAHRQTVKELKTVMEPLKDIVRKK